MSFDEPDEREEGELNNEPKKGRHRKQHVGEMEMPVSMVFKFLQLNPKRFGVFFHIILLEIQLSLNCCQNKYENSHNITHKFHHNF